MAHVMDWDGEHVAAEMRSLPPGRLQPLDEVAALTPEEEEGIRQALASIEADRALSFESVREHILDTLKMNR